MPRRNNRYNDSYPDYQYTNQDPNGYPDDYLNPDDYYNQRNNMRFRDERSMYNQQSYNIPRNRRNYEYEDYPLDYRAGPTYRDNRSYRSRGTTYRENPYRDANGRDTRYHSNDPEYDDYEDTGLFGKLGNFFSRRKEISNEKKRIIKCNNAVYDNIKFVPGDYIKILN